ncbi:Cell death protease [Yamadazyma tenuis]|nr:Cell death protease [Yamadazyma tenuis]
MFVQAVFVESLHFKRDSDRSQFLVSKLPGLQENFKDSEIPLMFAGQLELYKENDTHLFFWKYSDNNIEPEYKKRTIFWLNGGPGCSSMDGALMEVGPFRIDSNLKVTKNPGSWHQAGDVVFVDQPAGTGFSYSKEFDHDLDQVSWQFLRFMEVYFEMFPEDADNEIYFAGESYAGQYIPYIADGILKRNKNLKEGQNPYNLKGLLIGNGWIAPDVQSLSYLPYAVAAGIINTNHPAWTKILKQHEKCQNAANNMNGDSLSDFAIVDDICEGILTTLLYETKDNSAAANQQCFNMYDYTLKDSYPSCGMNWPPDLVNVNPFLNSLDNQASLNLILKKKWHECSGRVGSRFTAKKSYPAVKLLPGILEQIPVVLFNGNRDIICNYIGTENFIKQMEWNGATGFQEDYAYDWVYDGQTSGYIKTERNLTFINIFDASHMVPFDKPELSRSLIDVLLKNFDIETVDIPGDTEKKAIVTYPLGVRKLHQEVPQPSSTTAAPTSTNTQVTGSFTQFASSGAAASSPAEPSSSSVPAEDKASGSSRITRIIQLVVLVIIIWGVYMLYSTYKSRPSSIIRTGPSGRKKNVQWADQLRSFQNDEEVPPSGLLNKALGVFRRGDTRGNYTPTDTDDYLEDIEMGENLVPGNVDHFIVDSEDEEEVRKSGT